MIALAQFLSRVREIDAEHPLYRKGGDGSDGMCDCIGLIIGSLRRAGGTWTGTHGSNYAARSEVDRLRRVSSAADLQVGDVVLKKYEPGEIGWDLPAAYAGHADQRDYYHAGVVLSVNPLDIVHCTSPDVLTEAGTGGAKTMVKTSIRHDGKLGRWSYAARLKKVDDGAQGGDEGMDVLYRAEVATQSGPLNIRSGPGMGCVVIAKAPKGALVDVLAEGEWMRVRYGDAVGYASGEYLQKANQNGADADQNAADAEQNAAMVYIPLTLARQLYAALSAALSVD